MSHGWGVAILLVLWTALGAHGRTYEMCELARINSANANANTVYFGKAIAEKLGVTLP